jgi:hypothetical protein
MASNPHYEKEDYELNNEEDSSHHEQVSPERIFQIMRSRSLNMDSIKKLRTQSLGSEHIDVEIDDEEKIFEDDVRKELFDSIPEYPHSEDFQRVIITESSDPIDHDTILACRTLKKMIELREKWMSCHPYPPQDLDSDIKKSTMSLAGLDISAHGGNQSDAGSVKRKFSDLDPSTFRRRMPPEYNIFDAPLPPSTDKYRYEFQAGLIHIHHAAASASGSSQSIKSEPNKIASIFPVYTFDEFVRDFTTVNLSLTCVLLPLTNLI